MTTGRIGTLVGNVIFPVLLDIGCVVPFFTMAGTMACEYYVISIIYPMLFLFIIILKIGTVVIASGATKTPTYQRTVR